MSLDMIPATSAKWLVEQMRGRGVESRLTLAKTGLTESWLKQDNAMLSHDQYCRIVSNALDESGDPALGLTLGEQTDLNWHGYWGYAMISSPTWYEAGLFALKYWELNGSLVKLVYRESGDEAFVDILPAFPQIKGRLLRYAVEEWLVLSGHDFQFTTGLPPHDRVISLAYPEPGYARVYHEVLKCPVTFNCPVNQAAALLERWKAPIITANARMAEFCIQQCESMLAGWDRSDSLVESIRQQLVVTPGQFPGFGKMAEKLGISQRTLSRRLQERDTTYKNIVNEVRSSLAKEYLLKTSFSIDEISNLVGFSETASFRRFFKNQTGTSASDIRRVS